MTVPPEPFRSDLSHDTADPRFGSQPDPDDPRRIWFDGDDHPEIGDEEFAAVDDRLAAGIATGLRPRAYANGDPNEDAVRVFRRGDRTILLCLDGHNGHIGAQVAADILDLELSESHTALDDDAFLIDLLWNVSNAVRTESAQAGHPESRTTVALAIVEDDCVRWASVGNSLIALVHPDGTIERLGTPEMRFLGEPTSREELVETVDTGIAQLWPGGWLVLASDGLTDFTRDWRTTVRDAATVRTHYPMDDPRRRGVPPASTVVRQLIAAAYAGGAGDAVSVIVLGRETFFELPGEEMEEAIAAWFTAGGGGH